MSRIIKQSLCQIQQSRQQTQIILNSSQFLVNHHKILSIKNSYFVNPFQVKHLIFVLPINSKFNYSKYNKKDLNVSNYMKKKKNYFKKKKNNQSQEFNNQNYKFMNSQKKKKHQINHLVDMLLIILFIYIQIYNLQQQIFQLESNKQRGNSTQFIKELENKIIMLQKLNENLNQDNQKLQKIINVEQLRQERDLQCKNLQDLEIQYENFLKQFEQFDCKKLEELEQMNQENKIENLVIDLEDKITGLIIENEKLIQQIQEEMKLDQNVEQMQLELQQQQIAYQKLKHEEVQYRFKYDTAIYDEKVSKREKPNENKEKVIENIKNLEEENIKLRELLKEIDCDEEIKDLEDRIRVIAQDNRKLEIQLLQK
ncbi:unnamed protein product [Paramecium sonneborni]|uniref:Transmembrane protein n=1 Tax=Paramecium sonneborni TaxID=65129 RepID=A0A8S1RP91_9CILI|nr:unnamed protein product [Paramecium sonneborni]